MFVKYGATDPPTLAAQQCPNQTPNQKLNP